MRRDFFGDPVTPGFGWWLFLLILWLIVLVLLVVDFALI